MSKFQTKNRIGKTYGMRTVIARAPKEKGSTEAKWVCKCVCGSVTTVRGHSLSETTSCGCLPQGPRISLVGKLFGRLKVKAYAYYQRKQHYWYCTCSCGTSPVVSSKSLLNGKLSCGCLGKEVASLRASTLTGAAAMHWKGGRTRRVNGYMWVRRPEHPNANKEGYVYEHTYVMSQHLGRALLPTEKVHHKNGLRADNRLENLELWCTRTHPCGQRVDDLVAFAKHVMALYPEKFTNPAENYNVP